MEKRYSPERSTYVVKSTQSQALLAPPKSALPDTDENEDAAPSSDVISVPDQQPLFYRDEDAEDEGAEPCIASSRDRDTDMGVPHLLIEDNESGLSQPSSDLTSIVAQLVPERKTSSLSTTSDDTRTLNVPRGFGSK